MLLGKAFMNRQENWEDTPQSVLHSRDHSVSQELEGNRAALCQVLNFLHSLNTLKRLYRGNLKLGSPEHFLLKHLFIFYAELWGSQ